MKFGILTLASIIGLGYARRVIRRWLSERSFLNTYFWVGNLYRERFVWSAPVEQINGLCTDVVPYRVAATTVGGRFVFDISAAVVVTMGGRPRSVAQRKGARELAGRLMREANHRDVHIVRDLPSVMALICTPTAMERAFEAIIESGVVYDPQIDTVAKLIWNGGYPRGSTQQ